jgi:hypothetical protein
MIILIDTTADAVRLSNKLIQDFPRSILLFLLHLAILLSPVHVVMFFLYWRIPVQKALLVVFLDAIQIQLG